LAREELALPPKPPSRRWTKLKAAYWGANLLVEVVYLERAKKLAHTKPSSKGSWPWSEAKMTRQR